MVAGGASLELPARYEIQRCVGRGMSGEVFKAYDRELGREVAVKVFADVSGEEEALGRMEREARVLASHPHEAVVPLYDASLTTKPPYLVLGWMDGGDLVSLLDGRREFGAERAVRAAVRLARALAHLHRCGVLHRDVKSANVLLDGAGEVYLADFGLVLDDGSAPLTQTGFVVGTPRYMAPEILRGEGYTVSTDLYALGIVILEMLLGHSGDSRLQDEDRRLALTEEIEPPALRAVVRRCLGRLAETRYDDADAVADRLEEVLETGGFGKALGPDAGPAKDATITAIGARAESAATEAAPRVPPGATPDRHRRWAARGGGLGLVLLAAWAVSARDPVAPVPTPAATAPLPVRPELAARVRDALAGVEAARAELPDIRAVRKLRGLKARDVGMVKFFEENELVLDPETVQDFRVLVRAVGDWVAAAEELAAVRPLEPGELLDLAVPGYLGTFLEIYWRIRHDAMGNIVYIGSGPAALGEGLDAWADGATRIREVVEPLRARLLDRALEGSLAGLVIGLRLAAVEPPPGTVPAALVFGDRLAREGADPFARQGAAVLEVLLGVHRQEDEDAPCRDLLSLADVLFRELARRPEDADRNRYAVMELGVVTCRISSRCAADEDAALLKLAAEVFPWAAEHLRAREFERIARNNLHALARREGRVAARAAEVTALLTRLAGAG